MAKKGRGKAKAEPGDLRAVSALVEAWIAGDASASEALMMFGRDASFEVLSLAEQHQNKELAEFGRRLVAVPPHVETNLYGLRRRSVSAAIENVARAGVQATEVRDLVATGGSIAFFDPHLVIDDLVKGGRPRKDTARLAAGDLAWFGLPTADPRPVRIEFGPPPEGVTPLRLRLKVKTGVVFAGPPEASDGPRLGAVRIDPYHTALDAHVERGVLMKWRPGLYALHVFLEGDTIRVCAEIEADPEATLDIVQATAVGLSG